ncbi:MAG: M36 family metallopeptidase [Candidatus Cloacimonetes bacterium]|nr:M36 family metallopeptidase [Candidatus Cloacimonadota bacterium]
MKKLGIFAICSLISLHNVNANSRKVSFFQPNATPPVQQFLSFTAAAKTPEEVARDFILSQKSQLGYFSNFQQSAYDTEDLEMEDISETDSSTHVVFSQKYEGIEIYAQQVKIHMKQDQSVLLMNGNYINLDEVDVDNIVIIKSNEAIKIALLDLNSSHIENTPKAKDIYIVKGDKIVRGYKIEIFSQRPLGSFVYLIEAKDGNIHAKFNHILHQPNYKFAKSNSENLEKKVEIVDESTNEKPVIDPLGDAKGWVHSPSYGVNKKVKLVTLDKLDQSNSLQGESCHIENKQGTKAKSGNGEFFFKRDNPHYDEVMVYYHITHFYDYLKTLGVKLPKNKIKATVHFNDDDNSFYNPQQKELFFGDGGIPDAHDADIVLHEYGHSLVDALSGLQGGWGSQGGAMHEGFGDYFAASFFGDPNIGEWDSSAYSEEGYLRTLKNAKIFPDDLEQEVHADGELWGATLWDLWKKLGRKTTDTLVYHSLSFLPEDAIFRDGLTAILSADATRFKGKYRKDILKVFLRRGIKAQDTAKAAEEKEKFNTLYDE